MAVESYKEAIAPETTQERKQEIEIQLLEYCKLDAFAWCGCGRFLVDIRLFDHS